MSVFDENLKSMLGDMYQDDTEPAPQQMPVMEAKQPRSGIEGPGEDKSSRDVKAAVPVDEYAPAPKMQRGLIDRLYDCVLWLGICGGIAMLLWWFWQNDLMAMEAAYPCILACGVIGSFGAGVNFRK